MCICYQVPRYLDIHVFTQSLVFLYEVKIVQSRRNLITNAHSGVLYFIQFFESNMYVKVSRNLVTNAHSRVLCFIQFSESNMYVKVNVVEVV
jgi:hypothetical protein